MKKSVLSMIVLAASVAFVNTSCKKEGCSDPAALNYDEDVKEKNDDGSCLYDTEDTTTTASDMVEVSANVTSNTTWTNDKTYILTTRVAVTDGAILTIEPGTVIKGEAGSGANATALIIAQGAKLMAQGTATQPIIFTSTADQMTSASLAAASDVASPNLASDLDGLWGGLIILGSANISADAATAQIEGIPASDPNGLYGGTNDDDNSGTISYISIRHGGSNIGEGNEINGLTLGGVGSGTTIDHVEIVANQDDGIEFFGGTVDVSHLLIWNNGDDAVDTDQAWNGTLDNFMVINPGDEACELDGPEGSYINGNHTLTNGSIWAGDADGLVDLDDNTNIDMNNIVFWDLSAGQDFDQVPVDPHTFAMFEADIPAGEMVTDYFKDGSDAAVTDLAGGSATVGATTSEFTGWTWADAADAF